MQFNTTLFAAAFLSSTLLAHSAFAADPAVQVQSPWARATVQGQMATGAFMTLTAKTPSKLVGAESPAAGVTQVHEMKMDGGIMKMAEVKGGLSLPAGKAVELKPGGYHIMLMDLKAPLPKGTQVPLTLVFEDAQGTVSKLQLNVPVAAVSASGKMPMGAMGQD